MCLPAAAAYRHPSRVQVVGQRQEHGVDGAVCQQRTGVAVGVRALQRGIGGAAALQRTGIGVADRPDRNLVGVGAERRNVPVAGDAAHADHAYLYLLRTQGSCPLPDAGRGLVPGRHAAHGKPDGSGGRPQLPVVGKEPPSPSAVGQQHGYPWNRPAGWQAVEPGKRLGRLGRLVDEHCAAVIRPCRHVSVRRHGRALPSCWRTRRRAPAPGASPSAAWRRARTAPPTPGPRSPARAGRESPPRCR